MADQPSYVGSLSICGAHQVCPPLSEDANLTLTAGLRPGPGNPRRSSSRWIRRYPQSGFSRAVRSMVAASLVSAGGRREAAGPRRRALPGRPTPASVSGLAAAAILLVNSGSCGEAKFKACQVAGSLPVQRGAVPVGLQAEEVERGGHVNVVEAGVGPASVAGAAGAVAGGLGHGA